MWISREQAAVFALVLTMAWAQPFCDLSKMETMDASTLNGIVYPVLVSDARIGARDDHLGYDLQPFKNNDEQYINITVYYMEKNTQTCQHFTEKCKISDNACHYDFGISFYEVAHGDKYRAFYTYRGDNFYTLEIYAKNFQTKKTIKDLPQNMRNKIEAACGSNSINSDFYARRFPAGEFIPNCL